MLHQLAFAFADLSEADGEHGRGRIGAHHLGFGLERNVEALEGQCELKRLLDSRAGQFAGEVLKTQSAQRPVGCSQPMAVHPHEQGRGDPVVPPLIWPLPLDLNRHDLTHTRTFARAKFLWRANHGCRTVVINNALSVGVRCICILPEFRRIPTKVG